MAVFDPTQGFNAFAAGAQIGGNIRKSQTQRALAPMLANNDYEGAMKYVAGRGDLEAMDYIRPMQEKAAENAFSQKIGGMIASGDRKGAAAAAYGAGKFEIGAQIEAQISQMTKEQRETAAYVTQQIAGVGMSLLEVKDPAQRVALWQQKQQELAALGMDPQQLAQFDPLNDALIESKIGEAQTIGQRLEAARWQQSFDREGEWRAEDQEYRAGRDAVTDAQWQAGHNLQKSQAAASAASAGKYGVTPIYGRDANGNRIILQTSNAGGVMQVQVPEGVTLEDDYSKTFARETAKEDVKKEAYKTQAGLAVQATEESFNRLSAQIDDAISKTTDMNTGFLGQFIAAGDLDGLLETIGAVTAFDSLIALKAQGGTLGALSDTELNLLRSKVANLARSQTQEQLDANLEILRLAMQGSMQRIKAGYEAAYASGEYRATPSAAPSGPAPPAGAGLPPLPPGFVLDP